MRISFSNGLDQWLLSSSGMAFPGEVADNPRPADVADCTMTPAKVCETFGWKFSVPLREGLVRLIKNEGVKA